MSRAKDESQLMRAAVVGAGRIAQQHLRALTEWKLANVVGVCDLSPATATCAAERFKIPSWFTDYERMLRETQPQVVHITTTPASHFALARQAIEFGAHAVIEKPATLTLEELESLISLAEQKQLCVIEDYNYLFSGTVQRIVDLFLQGQLGDIVHVDAQICLNLLNKGSPFIDPNLPHWIHRMPGSIVADFATHLAYLAHAFIGPMKTVDTLYRQSMPESPLPVDEFRALVDAERGTAQLSLSCHAQPDMFVLRVFGTRGHAEAHLFEPRFTCELANCGPKPLVPLRNCMRVARQSFSGGWQSLFRKLSGGPASYDGLWELMRRSYAGLSGREAIPVDHHRIREVNLMVHSILSQGPHSSRSL
jgi:predicted dehydrogenase